MRLHRFLRSIDALHKLSVSEQQVCGWKRNSWNSFFRWHLLNLIIWKDMKSAFQRPHTHTSNRSVCPHVRGTPLCVTWRAKTIHLCGVKALHEHPPHTHTRAHTDKKFKQATSCQGRLTRRRVKLMGNLHGQLKRPIKEPPSPKTWYKGKDGGTALSDKRTSHFNRLRDEA